MSRTPSARSAPAPSEAAAPEPAASETSAAGVPCSLARALEVVGERWTFFIVREALAGVTRFAAFRATLGVAPDVLTARLSTLVDAGVMVRRPYQEPGQRAREAYHLTDSGRRLGLVVGALEQWGEAHAAQHGAVLADAVVAYRTTEGRSATVHFVDDRGRVLAADAVHLERNAAPAPGGPPDTRPVTR